METSPTQHPAAAGCLAACREARAFVERLTPAQYAAPVNGHSSIGAHMRHCIDHFLCFFRGLSDGEVDYDSRDRSADLELSREVFFKACDLVERELAGLGDLERAVRVRQIPAPGAASIAVESSIERELIFLSSHCIHHMALMAILAEIQGAAVRGEAGVAYSTQDYRRRTKGGA